jgi:hypothetical protein
MIVAVATDSALWSRVEAALQQLASHQILVSQRQLGWCIWKERSTSPHFDSVAGCSVAESSKSRVPAVVLHLWGGDLRYGYLICCRYIDGAKNVPWGNTTAVGYMAGEWHAAHSSWMTDPAAVVPACTGP